ncbi:hypothetical protein TUM18999_35750 [Pseudomonas tohonis]|uniref:Uncharacterized protein n=1 Tax=Pseudomonas tohonis TaxID=2725477 RepID=A0A6J4E8U3_9PSED|nr:hypothetical protein TUM18999_35750 [Pseudomonas tohonis]GJN54786.1 hypothetical protein TUM20286_45380 [Pseudomonas tohonis]
MRAGFMGYRGSAGQEEGGGFYGNSRARASCLGPGLQTAAHAVGGESIRDGTSDDSQPGAGGESFAAEAAPTGGACRASLRLAPTYGTPPNAATLPTGG